ncbi:TrmH family RNA methyltransferase [Aneurinibacillus soli]|uniref:23S rRNA (Uridine(2479)-2'-O)-methyltransferase n=1 Tax=Aneurinibacillus soli TaxID=1500254 RepID=A0A0U5B7H7_9BACL|nr:RNA methyltransferase [Aneurinibacillus soli]PYE57907.1 TrmH family RNA methyltransferase [Aneurinibacillus soli]BAU26908.1 23S rRNA (uridine(2479)-2'-O)-methyltransferase [Aneurinibacillus soli]
MEVITSVQNPRVKQWAKLHTRKEREKTGLFLIEGPHLVEEAYKSGAAFEAILLEEGIEWPSWLPASALALYVTRPVLEKLSETKTPQTMAAVIRMQETTPTKLPRDGFWLLLDRVQDPGNVGTLIRTADAAGLSGIIIGDGSADLYNGKTVRSTMGSLFHLPVWQENLFAFVTRIREQEADARVIGTSLQESKLYTDISYTGAVLLVIGNEGSGMSEEMLALADQNVIIPLYGQAESLNAAIAGSVVIYEAVRQRRL